MVENITNDMANELANDTNNGIENGYYKSHFKHTQFVPVTASTVKKQSQSDHQLMMSLLNRPMTADQAMMLTFAKERRAYSASLSSNDYGVRIKGAKNSTNSQHHSEHIYASLIAQDINSVAVTAPQ